MTKQIPLTQGKFAVIDDIDYEMVICFKWTAITNHGNWYAVRRVTYAPKKSRILSLHRFITNAPSNMEVDHINGDGLNCTRNNMRVCTQKQNSTNKKKPINSTSGYKGVTWNKTKKKWIAQIKVSQKKIHLGGFNDPKSAAKAYNEAAKKYFGEFAHINDL